MSENIKDIMGVTMDKIKTMASADTIIGDPIVLSETVTCIPVSKVSYGFASGGSDFGGMADEKTGKRTSPKFGGGGGAGMTITPVAFLVLQDGKVKILGIDESESSTEKAIGMIPDVVEKVSELFKKGKDKDKDNTEE
ncbi:MAG: GerW family sporulation protein [Acutalibacteraceae bacterium]